MLLRYVRLLYDIFFFVCFVCRATGARCSALTARGSLGGAARKPSSSPGAAADGEELWSGSEAEGGGNSGGQLVLQQYRRYDVGLCPGGPPAAPHIGTPLVRRTWTFPSSSSAVGSQEMHPRGGAPFISRRPQCQPGEDARRCPPVCDFSRPVSLPGAWSRCAIGSEVSVWHSGGEAGEPADRLCSGTPPFHHNAGAAAVRRAVICCHVGVHKTSVRYHGGAVPARLPAAGDEERQHGGSGNLQKLFVLAKLFWLVCLFFWRPRHGPMKMSAMWVFPIF